MGTLTGKTAVVTGSTSGIGLAYARAFASAGANIVLNGMGAPADIEKERSAIETDFKVKAVRDLISKLPDNLQDDPSVTYLQEAAKENTVTVVHLIYRSKN